MPTGKRGSWGSAVANAPGWNDQGRFDRVKRRDERAEAAKARKRKPQGKRGSPEQSARAGIEDAEPPGELLHASLNNSP